MNRTDAILFSIRTNENIARWIVKDNPRVCLDSQMLLANLGEMLRVRNN